MLYNLIIAPIETIVGWTFFFFNNKFSMLGPAACVAGVSLVINFLALPLYNIADALQEKERKIQKSLEHWVKCIKKSFKGDEQFMMLQTYYRENNYHPLYSLRSSLSILIEIPFFIAAYHYLSNCDALKGVSFLFIKDLGSPDRVFSIPLGKHIFYINILPVLMTVINLVSGAVYSKEAPAREKIQIYVLAAFFLVLLYNSPSGLVFYWILNNLFSLAKNIIKKLPEPGKVLHIIISFLLISFTIFFFITRASRLWKKLLLIFITLAITLIPLEKKLLHSLISKLNIKAVNSSQAKKQTLIFVLSGIALAMLCGFLLPASVIASSPIEFSFLGDTSNPLSYVGSSVIVFTGFFLLWPLVIYFLFDERIKRALPLVFFSFLILSLFNAFFMKSTYGELNAFFIFTDTSDIESISLAYFILPFIVLMAAIALYIVILKFNKAFIISVLLFAICFSEITLGIMKCKTINSVFTNYAQNIESEKENLLDNKIQPFYHLSKDKKNVVVLFLDRAVNFFFEKTMKEYPELAPAYSGFVYYPNAVSFGTATLTGADAIMGGYEYTPYNMNLRASEPLVDKHNEASLVMPKLFLDADFEVTVVDPPYPNYEWKGDLSAFKALPEITVAELGSKYSYYYSMEKGINLFNDPDKRCRNNIRNFSILQSLMPFLREFFYKNCYRENFVYKEFIDDISKLYYLNDITDFTSHKNTFTFIDNETTHNRYYMQAPDFEVPVVNQDIYVQEEKQYSVNITAYKMLAKWLNYLRENNCYDNTRIIIVSDHSTDLGIKEFEEINKITYLPEHVNCILLYKDFNSNFPIETDNSLMTNADTIFLAKEGLNISATNPFTKKELIQEKDGGVTIFDTIDLTTDHVTTQFKPNPEQVYHFDGKDIKNPESWKKVNLE